MSKAKNKLDIHFSSGKDDWATPQALFDEMNKKYGPFDLDVCATKENSKCGHNYLGLGTYYSPDTFVDGLIAQWHMIGVKCWMNPPYSRGQQAKWVKKAYEESQKGCTVVALLPARTDTRAFHTYIWDTALAAPKAGVKVEFLKGRVKFENTKSKANRVSPSSKEEATRAKHGAPFPSMIVVFSPPK